MPDALVGIRDAVESAFASRIVAVAPTQGRFDTLNGINYGGINYINANGNVGGEPGNGRRLKFIREVMVDVLAQLQKDGTRWR